MHHSPPRNETFVQVFDFGDKHAERTEIQLGDVEKGTTDSHNLVKWLTIRSHVFEAQLGFYQMDVRRRASFPFKCLSITLIVTVRLELGFFTRYEQRID